MKMEKGSRVHSFVIIYLVLGLLAGQSTAKFRDCFLVCLLSCAMSPFTGPGECLGYCIKGCPLEKASLDREYLCNIGCVTSMCINHITKYNPPAKERVEGCLDSCSTNYCTKN